MNIRKTLYNLIICSLTFLNCGCSNDSSAFSSEEIEKSFDDYDVMISNISCNLTDSTLKANEEYYCNYSFSCEKISDKFDSFALRLFIDTDFTSFQLDKCDTINYDVNDNYIDFHFKNNNKDIQISIFLTPSKDFLFDDICCLICFENCYREDHKCAVIFQNDDGSILQCSNIDYGSYAKYEKIDPIKTDYNFKYNFKGWNKDPSLTKIYGYEIFTANYDIIKRGGEFLNYNIPINCGNYPQSLVTDEAIILALDTISTTDVQGYKSYNGEKYYGYDGISYTDNNGNKVKAGYHYYKVEPIIWENIDLTDNPIFMAEYILDCQNYDDSNNNYENSNIRKWLNEDFLNTAFYYNNSMLVMHEVDNSSSSTGVYYNEYASNTTYDKIFLLSYAELFNNEVFIFRHDYYRKAITTEFARARGCYYSTKNDYLYNGSYFTRSPNTDEPYYVLDIGVDGGNGVSLIDGGITGIRPAISLSLTDK